MKCYECEAKLEASQDGKGVDGFWVNGHYICRDCFEAHIQAENEDRQLERLNN